ncbi:MAG: hypothetical protein NC302_04195 [Bacteroidales bacterium]|nr:hypothetical protein [Bacteroidales bacterium]
MKPSEQKYFADYFSHIYVEDGARDYPITQEILSRFSGSFVIPITHYKDIFNRAHQSFFLQKQAPALILAVKRGRLIYPGARVCQSFGNSHFYYTSNIMNCVYDCEYCYLQGMYPSGNIVLFVNLEDFFEEADRLLSEHPLYLCVSYDTDLSALEGITGFASRWADFASKRPGLTIEIRTKSARTEDFGGAAPRGGVIYAWTLSPAAVTDAFEHRTPNLDARLCAAKTAVGAGFTVRLCFDPMIYVPDYRSVYSEFYSKVFEEINASEILDVSLGLFRISADYLKAMRKSREGLISSYPYTNIGGVCSYDREKANEMLSFARGELSKYIEPRRIFEFKST